MQVIEFVRYQGTIKVTAVDRYNSIPVQDWMLQATPHNSGHKLTFFIERSEEQENKLKKRMKNV